MKGGKDEEKIMGPMFPRLHVKDTEKGGPRAPPRNKMALYEQLSVPSQRFSSGSQSHNNTSSLAPSASLSQGAAHERTVFSQFRIPPPAPADSTDNLHSHSSERLNTKTRIQILEQKSTKIANHQHKSSSKHFSPAVECGSFQPHDRTNSSRPATNPGDNNTKVAASTCSSSTHHHNVRDKHLKRPNTTDLRSRQHSQDHSEENPLESVTSKDWAGRTASSPLTREKTAEILNHAYASPVPEQNSPVNDLGPEDRGDVLENATYSDGFLAEPMGSMEKGNIVWVRNEPCSRASLGNDHGSPTESYQDKELELLQGQEVDRNDDVSETSMVDSVTLLDISPDDVVGVIGQKQFWKARRAIVNQQRLFTVQVFELHRLIKVQRLIAGSPHLLLDDTSYLNKSALEEVPAKKLSSDYGLKSSQQLVKQKTESQKPSQSTDCVAENAVRKLPSVSDAINKGHTNHHSSYGQYTGNPASAPVTTDNKAGWYFPPPGNQWLVPVMSPSEGLVYKPYGGPCPPAAGFMPPIYGGCGPMSANPMGGEFPGAAYGVPGSHPQGVGVFSGALPLSQSYFSPYGMPVMNPLIPSPVVDGMQSHGQQPLLLSTGEEATFNMHSRSSCNMSNRKSEAISRLQKFQASKESEIQGSTASSPGERAQEVGTTGNAGEGRDGHGLSLFPMGPTVQGGSVQHLKTHRSDQQRTQVIKVVPHNPRSANASAARIFKSIQQERRQNDSV